MNFSNNLQKLRKANGFSQEQLAEKLEVSRQSVSKWESGASYPEVDKIIMMSDIFDCSMDELVKGEYKLSKVDKDVEQVHKKFAFKTALGVFLCIFAADLLIFVTEMQDKNSVVGITLFLGIVLVAVTMFIYNGIVYNGDEVAKKLMQIKYDEEKKKKDTEKFAIAIATGVAIIIFGIIGLVSLEGIIEEHYVVSSLIGLIKILLLKLLNLYIFSDKAFGLIFNLETFLKKP